MNTDGHGFNRRKQRERRNEFRDAEDGIPTDREENNKETKKENI